MVSSSIVSVEHSVLALAVSIGFNRNICLCRGAATYGYCQFAASSAVLASLLRDQLAVLRMAFRMRQVKDAHTLKKCLKTIDTFRVSPETTV